MRYLPILRIKESEYISLGDTADAITSHIVPLLCQVPAGEEDEEPADVAYRRMDKLVNHWTAPSFYDPQLACAYDGLDAATLYNAAAARGAFAPCVPLANSWASSAREAAAEHGRAALRIDDPLVVLEDDIEEKTLAVLDALGLGPHAVTLLFDAGPASDPRSVRAAHRFPFMDTWQTVVVAGGAFQPIDHPTETRIPRTHLENWRAFSGEAPREVVFGDYGTLEGAYKPSVSYAAAAKLVYTEPADWLYVRGRSTMLEGNEQMYDICQRIVASEHWRGAEYSWGDQWIADRAEGRGNPGNPAMWIRAALTHHMTHVVREDV